VLGRHQAAQDGGGEVGCAGEGYLQGASGGGMGLALGEQALAHLAHGGFA
jgi:hypothetical protein